MNLADVMDELAERLRTIPDFQVFEWPTSPVTPPAALLSYPDEIDFDKLYDRAMDRFTDLPLVVLGGRANELSTRNELSALTAGAGDRSVKAVLESGTYTAFDSLWVARAVFDVHTIGLVDYLAAIFSLDITGNGV